MISKVATTFELDDFEQGVNELFQGLGDEILAKKYVVGIIYCFSDMDIEPFLRALKERFKHDLVGGTCIANFDHKEGFHDLSVTLTVLASDDTPFSVNLSDQITQESIGSAIEKSYKDLTSSNKSDPALVITLPPYDLNIMLDAFTSKLAQIAPDVQFIGGIPSYNGSGDTNAIIFNDKIYTDKMALLGIYGVKPVINVQNVTTSPIEIKRLVTSSKDNVVYRVGNTTFVEYLEEIGLPVKKLAEGNETITFLANPILLENVSGTGDNRYSFVRTLHKINMEDGSGVAIGAIPEGSTLSVCTLNGSQIEEAATAGVNQLINDMNQKPDYKYSTVIAVSCIARYLLMAPKYNTEIESILAKLPKDLTLSGFYSYGEIASIRGENNKTITFAHNESIAICAF